MTIGIKPNLGKTYSKINSVQTPPRKSTDFTFEEAMELLRTGAHGFTFRNHNDVSYFVKLDEIGRLKILLVTQDKASK